MNKLLDQEADKKNFCEHLWKYCRFTYCKTLFMLLLKTKFYEWMLLLTLFHFQYLKIYGFSVSSRNVR